LAGRDGGKGTCNPFAVRWMGKGGTAMGEKADEAKGRVKEAAGDLTDDDRLKREGKMDQAGAEVKEKTSDAVDKGKEAWRKVEEKVDGDK
jgi:uncharacterized protein YjbJ (UPF0337 family)